MGETHKPKSQEWQEFSAEIQANVNDTLEDLQIEIEHANELLRRACLEGSTNIQELASNIVQYLDKKWGFLGDFFLVTGKWYVPTEFSLTDNGIVCERKKQDAFNVVRSNGFMVSAVEQDNETMQKVGLSFVAADVPLCTSIFQGQLTLLSFALPNEISLQFMRPRGPETVGAEIKEISTAIEKADAMLQAYINHDCSSFYNASAAKQGDFLQSVIDFASLALPPKDSLDRVAMRKTLVSGLFVRNTANNKIYLLSTSDDTPIHIDHGVILDFTTLDTLRDGIGEVHYDNPSELATYNEGLCAVVSPSSISLDLSQLNNPDIIVPFRRVVGTATIEIESLAARE